ncbi:MAG: ImmA/IrrE family metallo-endopeptidase [Pirellulaceae bacterium]|nr:ImmA/IrrE family metallo-endopeptidase [Pirellulaceae bacterium]
MSFITWTEPSVVAFAGDADPVAKVIERARELVLFAAENGWSGPPFDPFELAEILGYRVIPSQDVQDALILADGGKAKIEFNPNRSTNRIRFSIAHEIGHAIFPDWKRQVRYRLGKGERRHDEWQLEMLCNIAAGEILMPAGSLPVKSNRRLGIDDLRNFRDTYEVSMESVMLRVIRLERRNTAVFVASYAGDQGYVMDYAIESNNAGFGLKSGFRFPPKTLLSECSALGFTSKGTEKWINDQLLHIECIAIPSLPGQSRPRVAGIAYRIGDRDANQKLRFVVGDATKPHGTGQKIIAHIVNDKAMTWGGRGFASAVRRYFPEAQSDFSSWAKENRENQKLGNSRVVRVDDDLSVFSMIAQQGYGSSIKPRIRYGALVNCLQELKEFAIKWQASVHMPRIGCGEAKGNWAIVQELILEHLCNKGVDVTIYDLPAQRVTKKADEQLSLFSTF